MPRSRAVLPEHFTGKRGQLDSAAWKLLQAMECHGDDAGLHPLDPAQLRAEGFPHHPNTTLADVRNMVVQLVDANLVVPYIGPDRRCYLFSRTFHEDQNPRNPSQARYPLPPFLTEQKEDKPGRTVYHYRLDVKALIEYEDGLGGLAVQYMYRTCRGQVGFYDGAPGVPHMCAVVKDSRGKERKEGLGLDLPSSTYRGAPTPPGRSRSSPVASDLLPNPETGAGQSCLDNPDSMFTRAVSGLEAATGSTLSPGVRHKLLAALQGFCGRLCLCHSLPHADRVARVLPVCRKVADEAVSILRGSEDWPSPDSLVVRYVEAIHTARKALMDEIIEAALPTESAHAKEG